MPRDIDDDDDDGAGDGRPPWGTIKPPGCCERSSAIVREINLIGCPFKVEAFVINTILSMTERLCI